VGQGNFSEDLSASGDHPTSKADDAGSFTWSASYTYAVSPVGSTSDKSSTGDLSAGYKKEVDAGGGFSFSKTPGENLTNSGPEAWFGWNFTLGGRGSKEDFHPSIEPKFDYKGQNYTQTFSGTTTVSRGNRRTVTRPTTGTEAIKQNAYALSVDVAPIEPLTVKLAGTSYKYNKDVATFMGLLDSPKAVSSGRSVFTNTLGGLPKSAVELDVTDAFADTWSIEGDFTFTKIQVDGSTSTGSKLEVSKELSAAWKLGLGLDHETSQSQGQENLTVLDLAYSF
jgi:hypothetical protein